MRRARSQGVMRADIRRGDLYWVDWSPGRGSEQTGTRPVLVIQTDAANRNPNYPNTIVLTVTSVRRDVPTHVGLEPSEYNDLKHLSFVKCEQIMTIDKDRL